MGAISDSLRYELTEPEFSEGYAESFQDAYIATQIKVLREQNEWTQAKLAEQLNTTQTVISRIENVNYSAWNIGTLKKLARAFRVRLKVSFETYGSLIHDVENFSRESLKRVPREKDHELTDVMPQRDAETEASEREALVWATSSIETSLNDTSPGSILAVHIERTGNEVPPESTRLIRLTRDEWEAAQGAASEYRKPPMTALSATSAAQAARR